MQSAARALAVAVLAATAAHATDGVIEINQARALAGGVSSCDGPGFPVDLCEPGSYRLTSDLAHPGDLNWVVFIHVPGVTLDLNGFGILGGNTCQYGGLGWPTSCAASALTIEAAIRGGDRTTILNGRVVGNIAGIHVGAESIVRDVLVTNNGGVGVSVGAGTVVSGVNAISNLGVGLECRAGCTASEVVATSNSTHGIQLLEDGSLTHATAMSNASAGIRVGPNAQLSQFSSVSNGLQGVVAGDGASISTGAIRSNGWTGVPACGLEVSGGAGFHGVVITSIWGGPSATVCSANGVNLGSNACQGVPCP